MEWLSNTISVCDPRGTGLISYADLVYCFEEMGLERDDVITLTEYAYRCAPVLNESQL